MLRNKTAKKIASHWHGGQWSSFYQFSSSGVYMIENHLRYLQEVETDLHPEYKLYPGELTKGQETELNNLKAWFEEQGRINGIETVWSKHELYGYLIPYLADNVPDELTNKITQIAYLK